MKLKFLTFLAILISSVCAANEPGWIAIEGKRDVIVPGVHYGWGGVDGGYRIPQFRREFILEGKVRKATAQVCGLGHFEFSLNGRKVGDHFLDPGWTCYDKEALYVEFDVTKDLRSGDNVIDVMLGTGFYTIPGEGYRKLVCSYGQPKLWMRLDIECADGSRQSIVSDCDSWKVCDSPVTFSSIYAGESYDARLETSPDWQKPVPAEAVPVLKKQDGTELVIRRTVPEKEHFQGADGSWIYDLGQNFSGIVRIEVKGQSGQSVELWPGELLDEDGNVTQEASGGPYVWKYTLCGSGVESWQPRFTYYGQRYVSVRGAVPEGADNPDNLPVIIALTGLHTCTASPEAGKFECGFNLFNRTHEFIDWAIRSNTQSVITDCPHREKLGWMEQDHLMQYSIQYRYNVKKLYEKLFNDMEASQWDNGCIPTIAPMYVMFADGFEDTPEWGSAFIISQWYLYRWYGDKTHIEQHYQAMQRYAAYLGSRADGNIVAYGLGDWFDIGPDSPGRSQLTSNGVSATAIYYYDIVLMAKMARLLGKTDDAAEYEALSAQIRASFNAEFYHEEGYYDRNSQTANAMALYLGLVEERNREKVLASLIADIEGRGYALTAGDIGYRFVVQALQEAGRGDVIFKMNSRTDVPGYGWQLEHGATALTESWQAYGFVSNNHLMLGHLMEWFYGGLCGIRQTEESVGFRHLLIAPQIIPEVGMASASFETGYGTVRSSWAVKGRRVILRITVPKGCDAQLEVPEYSVSRHFGPGRHRVLRRIY